MTTPPEGSRRAFAAIAEAGRPLMKVAVIAAASLLAVATAVALLLAALEMGWPSEFWSPWGAFRAGLYASLALGAGPAMLVGAPTYWLLWRAGFASTTSAVLLGAASGALAGLIEPALVAWGMACGAVAAGLTHRVARRWLGAKNRVVPAPPRGRA